MCCVIWRMGRSCDRKLPSWGSVIVNTPDLQATDYQHFDITTAWPGVTTTKQLCKYKENFYWYQFLVYDKFCLPTPIHPTNYWTKRGISYIKSIYYRLKRNHFDPENFQVFISLWRNVGLTRGIHCPSFREKLSDFQSINLSKRRNFHKSYLHLFT